MKRPFEIYVLSLLILFLSLGAIYGGVGFIISPDGSLLQMDEGWLDLIPFTNFLIPGVILFIVLGLFPLLALFGLFSRKTNRLLNSLNIFSDKHWGWTYSIYAGIISIIWIISQQMMTEYFVLQPIISAVGILIIIVCLVPRVQSFYSMNKNIKEEKKSWN